MPLFTVLPFGWPLTPEDWSDRGTTDPLGRLWRQHTLLRAALVRVESACEDADLQKLSVACDRLARLLRLHMRQEGQLAVQCCRRLRRLSREELGWLAVEHYTEQEYVRVVRRCLATPPYNAWDSVRFAARQAAAELRRHLNEQEAGLFHLLASALEPTAPRRPQRPRVLNRLVPARAPVPLRPPWPYPGGLP